MELIKELKNSLEEIGKFTFIKNRYLCTIYANSDFENKLYNESYKKRKKAAEELLEKKEYLAYLTLVERPFRFEALSEIFFEIPVERLFNIIEYVWCDSENPGINASSWKILFEYTKRLGIYEDSKKNLPEKLTVYRGCRDKKNGLSWTKSYKTAKFFSERNYTSENKGTPTILKKVVKKKDILFYTNLRGEEEIILL